MKVMNVNVDEIPDPTNGRISVSIYRKKRRKVKNGIILGSGFAAFLLMTAFLGGRAYVPAAVCFVYLMLLMLANSDLIEK